jgi:hypothetical protein
MICYIIVVDFMLFQNFLLRVASHPILSFDRQFIGFLQQDESWRESIKDAGKLWQFDVTYIRSWCYI